MGETTKTGQGTSSAKVGQSSDGKGGTTSKKPEGKFYTTADIEKIKSDAITPVGREKAAAERERDELRKQNQSISQRLEAVEKEQNDNRLAEARGDPKALQIYQREQTLAKREREVATKESDVQSREAALKTEREAIDGDKHKVNIAYIAAKHGIDQDELESLGIKDADALEKVAEKLSASKGGAGEGEGGGEAGEGTGEADYQPDSGEGAGGKSKALTASAVEKMSVAEVDKALSGAKEPPK